MKGKINDAPRHFLCYNRTRITYDIFIDVSSALARQEGINVTIREMALRWSEWPWLTPIQIESTGEANLGDVLETYSVAEMIVERRPGGWIYRARNGARFAVRMSQDGGTVALLNDPDCALADDERDGAPLRAALECAGALKGIVSLHAACVELNGSAVAFTAPSGTGKSTRARAWIERIGAEFVSGDRPGILPGADGPAACGMPWDGKEQIHRRAAFPLRAILEVRRAPFNRLRPLSRQQAIGLMTGQCFLPMWDERAATAVMAAIRRVADTVPVYRLFCGPDGDSAQWTCGALFENREWIEQEVRPDMKIREGFVLRNIVGEHIVMPVGENINKFEGALVLNDVSAFLWESLRTHISREDLLSLLLAEFEVERDVAEKDLDVFLDQLRAQSLLEEERAG